jgi:hypothetical protein
MAYSSITVRLHLANAFKSMVTGNITEETTEQITILILDGETAGIGTTANPASSGTATTAQPGKFRLG